MEDKQISCDQADGCGEDAGDRSAEEGGHGGFGQSSCAEDCRGSRTQAPETKLKQMMESLEKFDKELEQLKETSIQNPGEINNQKYQKLQLNSNNIMNHHDLKVTDGHSRQEQLGQPTTTPAGGAHITGGMQASQGASNSGTSNHILRNNDRAVGEDRQTKDGSQNANIFDSLNRNKNGNLQDAEDKEKLKAEAGRNQQVAEANTGGGNRRARRMPMIDLEEQDAQLKMMEQMQMQQIENGDPEGRGGGENAGQPAPPVKNLKKGQVVGNYVLGRDLGKGTFGEVMVGTHSLTGEKVAIKVLEKDKIVDVHDVERVAREIHILKVVRHPTIVQLYEIIETSKELYLIMEYARGGELFEYIVNRKRVREKDACKFLHQILSGVDYLHKLGICHRDLKPENLLMDDFNNIKIVDFGLSNTYKPGEFLQTACGSPCYAAPEMVAGKKYDGLSADMWSCGVIIYAMVCGFLPFEDPKTNKLYHKILNAEYQIPDFVSESCQDLIRKILCTDPKERLSIEGIRAHPWYKQVKVREYHGIYVGQNPIPVDMDMVAKINDYETGEENLDEQQAKKYVINNRHNSVTTIYYLILKKHLRKGGQSIADITKYHPDNFKPQTLFVKRGQMVAGQVQKRSQSQDEEPNDGQDKKQAPSSKQVASLNSKNIMVDSAAKRKRNDSQPPLEGSQIEAQSLLPDLVNAQPDMKNGNQGGKKLASQIKLKKEMLISSAGAAQGGSSQAKRKDDEFLLKENNYTQNTSKKRIDTDRNNSEEIGPSSANKNASRRQQAQRDDRQMIHKSRINIDQINQMQEVADEDETVNFDPFGARGVEGDDDQDTMDASRMNRGRGANAGNRANEKQESKSPSPRQYFQNRNNELVVRNQITSNIKKPNRQPATVQLQNHIQIQGQGGGEAHAPALSGPSQGLQSAQNQQQWQNQGQFNNQSIDLSKRKNMQNPGSKNNQQRHRYGSQPPTITNNPPAGSSNIGNKYHPQNINQFDNVNPLIISSQMAQMEDYNAMQKDDYFQNETQSISFKNRDIFANFTGAEPENHSMMENYATKPLDQSDEMNMTHQSLMTSKDERKGIHNTANNRINQDALQDGSSSNIKSVQSKFGANKVLIQSQHNPLQNRQQVSSNYGSTSVSKNVQGQMISAQLPSRRTALYNSVEGNDILSKTKPQNQFQPQLTRTGGNGAKNMNQQNQENLVLKQLMLMQNQQNNRNNLKIQNAMASNNKAKNPNVRQSIQNQPATANDQLIHFTQRRNRNNNSRLQQIQINPQAVGTNSKTHRRNITFNPQNPQFQKVAQQNSHLLQYGGANSAADRYQTQSIHGPNGNQHGSNNTQMNFYQKLIVQPNQSQNQANLPNMAALRTGSSGASGASGASAISGLSLTSNVTGGIPQQVTNNGGVLTTGAKRKKERSVGLYPDLVPQVHSAQHPGQNIQYQGLIPNIQPGMAQNPNFNDSYLDSNSQEGFYRRFQRNQRNQNQIGAMNSGGNLGHQGQSAVSRASGSAVSGLSGASGISDGLQNFGVSLTNQNALSKANRIHYGQHSFNQKDASLDNTLKVIGSGQAHLTGGGPMTNDDYALLNQSKKQGNNNIMMMHELNTSLYKPNPRQHNTQALSSTKNTINNSSKPNGPAPVNPKKKGKAKPKQSYVMQSQKLDEIHQLIVNRQHERTNMTMAQTTVLAQSVPASQALQVNQISTRNGAAAAGPRSKQMSN